MENNAEILLVEDNMEDAELVLRSLRKNHIGNSILHLVDGVEALDYIFAKGKFSERNIEKIPRIILLDLKMPKIGGIEVLRLIKSDERMRTIPVVIMTASREDRDRIESYQLGADSYIIKPVSFDNFTKVVQDMGLSFITVQPH